MRNTKLTKRKLSLAVLAVCGAILSPIQSFAAAELVAYWDFEKVEADGVSIKSVVGNYAGNITEAAILTPANGGRPKGGGKGFDVSAANKGYLLLEALGDANPMNKAAVNDQVSIVIWQKNNANINASSFWGITESQARGFQFHVPWSDGTIYFDTMGCCGGNTRLSQNVEAKFSGFDWTAWHHYAFIKDGGHKVIYVDGEVLAEGDGYDPLSTDFSQLYIGGAGDSKAAPDGIIDDFAIYKGALTQNEVKALVGGAPLVGNVDDTDGDGMPNTWEVQYGFKPSDASDAAKDANGNGISNLDEYKRGFNPLDKTVPTLLSAVGSSTFDTVTVTFSAELDPATATNLANYALSPTVAITAASYKSKVVTLTTAKQTAGGTAYTLTVNNVKSANSFAVAANSKATFYSYILTKAGVLKFSYWGNITGTPVDNLYADPRYPASPDMVGAVFSFNSRDIFPNDSHENYGAVIEGYVTPAETGNYDFFLRSDDASELWISPDDKPANLVQVAVETGCCAAFMEVGDPRTTSSPIALTAGKNYFIRVVYKEGGGGDYAQVAWRKVGVTTSAGSLLPIPGKFLSSAVDLPAPAEGIFLTQTPAPNAKGVSPVAPISIVHLDGKSAWTATNVTLKIDGVAVKPTITKDGIAVTIAYAPTGILPSKTKHIITLGYPNPAGTATTMEWAYETIAYSGIAKDKVASIPGIVTGNSVYTADAGGRSGKAGDYGMDLTTKGGAIIVPDVTWVKAATSKDEMTVGFWAKKYDTADGSAFWFNSPSSSGTSRGFQAHVPWSNNNIYFDTAGCCTADTQRMNAGIDTFLDYTGDATWWQKWHYYVFSKKGQTKQIWIDGTLFLEGSGADPLPNDFSNLMIGSDGAGGGLYHAVIDDFAVFSTQLVEADIKSIVGGAAASALPSSKGLIAYWDFNTITKIDSVNNGLVAYWNFDDNLKDSVKNFHGTAKGTNAVAFVDSISGFGKAITLDGTDQYVEITGGNENELEFPGGSMSIAGWFKVDAFDREWQALIAKGEGSNYRVARRSTTGSIAYAGGAGEGNQDAPVVNDGAWHHFVAVTDAKTNAFGTALYVDGVLHEIQPAKPVLTANAKNLLIGANPDTSPLRFWKGQIDEIGIWNRVLTADEVAVLWNSGKGTPLSTWPMPQPPASPPALSIANVAGKVTLTFEGTLESADSLAGPWTSVTGASPLAVTASGTQKFYRAKR